MDCLFRFAAKRLQLSPDTGSAAVRKMVAAHLDQSWYMPDKDAVVALVGAAVPFGQCKSLDPLSYLANPKDDLKESMQKVSQQVLESVLRSMAKLFAWDIRVYRETNDSKFYPVNPSFRANCERTVKCEVIRLVLLKNGHFAQVEKSK